jgi:hypothetical protein
MVKVIRDQHIWWEEKGAEEHLKARQFFEKRGSKLQAGHWLYLCRSAELSKRGWLKFVSRRGMAGSTQRIGTPMGVLAWRFPPNQYQSKKHISRSIASLFTSASMRGRMRWCLTSPTLLYKESIKLSWLFKEPTHYAATAGRQFIPGREAPSYYSG